jgi:hypothetical protein
MDAELEGLDAQAEEVPELDLPAVPQGDLPKVPGELASRR